MIIFLQEVCRFQVNLNHINIYLGQKIKVSTINYRAVDNRYCEKQKDFKILTNFFEILLPHRCIDNVAIKIKLILSLF